MNRLEQADRANDVIAFLSAFGTSYKDARTIAYIVFEKIRSMNEQEYNGAGAEMAGFMRAMQEAPEQGKVQ